MKPILFNTSMVQANQAGNKTATRRVVKGLGGIDPYRAEPADGHFDDLSKWDFFYGVFGDNYHATYAREIKAPYAVGDILYVRETWAKEAARYFYRADFDSDYLSPCETLSGGYPFECTYHPGCEGCNRGEQRVSWKPSIHMPREAARLFLLVLNIRVERLQDITTEQICKEGVWVEPPGIVKGINFPEGMEKWSEEKREDWFQAAGRAIYIGKCQHINDLHRKWERLWDALNAKRGFGWDVNPWVWVIEFERISREAALSREGEAE